VYAFLVSLWTAFESLAKDAWIAVLNKYPAEFARRAFEAQLSSQPGGDDTGGGSKVIPIRMIERYRFDLREAMGFLAATRFDFGNCRSMRLAYRVILKDEDLELFLNPDLNELESMRHVIVHRAGYVDAEFLKRNKAYPGAIGELLEIGGGVESLGKSVDASILAGIRLLALLDDRIRFL
jgi:hypothetical protein